MGKETLLTRDVYPPKFADSSLRQSLGLSLITDVANLGRYLYAQ